MCLKRFDLAQTSSLAQSDTCRHKITNCPQAQTTYLLPYYNPITRRLPKMMFPTKKEGSLKDSSEDSEVKTQAQAIDVKDLSEEDLQSLRKEDPFMYYSIPAIRMATIHGKDIDPPDKVALCCSNLSSDGQQEPASKRTKSTYPSRSKTMVLRQTRISFEAPMNLEDIFA